VDGVAEVLVLSTVGWEKRAIEEPPSEVVVRGPREGFTETLRTNTALLRRKIRNPNLTFEIMNIGKQTKTEVCIVYIRGIAYDSLVAELKRRLQRIKTDSILESGYIEEFIEDAPFSIFETVDYTERPDAIAGKVLEGRVAIIINGTPVVLTVPAIFLEFFQSPEDYYLRSYYSTLVRLVRYAAFAFSLLSPAIYVALVTFHQELLPTPLLISIAAAKEGVPFPAAFEAISMGLVFEILREAGIRQPRPIGQAVSIVGALVIGQAAVTAGFVSAPMVIVVALTAIASFVTPKLSDLTALLRILLTIMAGCLGAFGIMIGLL
jgi:spore germination protein KA